MPFTFSELYQRLLSLYGRQCWWLADHPYAFERPVFVIDTYTRRLLIRLQMIKGNERYEDLRRLFEENLPKRVDLYKQFHALIVVHAKQCGAGTKKNKLECDMCQLAKRNAYSASS